MEGLASAFSGLITFLAEFYLMNGISDYSRMVVILILSWRADLFRPFLKRFVLITIDVTCYSRARIHLELPRRFDLASFYVFQIDRHNQRTPNDKHGHMFIASAAKWLALQLKVRVTWAAFYFLRLCERLLPANVLSRLLWPPAAAWDLLHLRQRTPLTCRRRLPESWRPKRWRFLRRQGLGLYHSQFFCMWPDRLCDKRWLSRCRLEGAGNLIGAREGDPGVVLASLHFGPYELLPYWLRAYGIVTTSVRVKPPEPLKSLTDYQCSLTPPADVPVFLYAEDLIPLPRFSHVRKILGPGRRLLVMVDVAQGIQVDVPFEDRIFRMSTGAIQLATMANADLIPCLIVEICTWKFVIRFGGPVPRQYLGKVPDMQAVGAHLLKEFSQVVSRYPEQCKIRLARAMWPPADNGAKRSAASQTITVSESV